VIRYFVTHPTVANLLMVILLVIGFIALPHLRRETFPVYEADVVVVSAVYPGASPETVEETLVQRIEDAVDGVENVIEVQSQAREGFGQVSIEMDSEANLTTFVSDVKSAVDGIADFPSEAEDPIITRSGSTSPVVSIAVTGAMSVSDMKAYCEELKRELQRYDEISQVTITGFSDRQLQIRLKEGVVSQYGIGISDLAAIISTQSLDMPAGSLDTRDGEILVRFAEERRTARELEDLVIIGGGSGGEVRLGTIAEITEAFEHEEDVILFNGKRAGLLNITKTNSQDALVVLGVVKEFLKQVEPAKPRGVALKLTQDRASVINIRLALLVTNGWQGLLLVFGSLWLFFNLRLAFWVAAGLPVSFLGALFVMEQIGYSLNMMTMLALLMALGLLMDDAIVLSENIAAHRQRGATPIEAAIAGVKEVAVGVFSSFATTLAIFIPLAFLDGNIGKVLQVIPVVLCLVIAVSLIEAFLILPNHLAHMHDSERSRWRLRFDAAFETLRDRHLGRIVDRVIKHRYAVVGGTIAIFLISIGMIPGGYLKFEGMPALEGNTVQLRLLLPQGSTFDKTRETVDRALAALEQTNDDFTKRQKGGATFVKSTAVQYNANPDVSEAGPHLATITADLLPVQKRNGTIAEMLQHWRTALGPISDVTSANFTEPIRRMAGDAISVRVQGDHLDDLDAAARDIVTWYQQFEGVFDLSSDLRPGKPEVLVQMKPGAMSANLRGLTVAQQLRAGLSGTTARQVQVGLEEFEVHVQLASSEADTLSDLEYFQLSVGNGKHIPLGTVANLTPQRGYSRIARVDSMRTITVTGDVDTDLANAQELASLFKSDYLAEVEQRYPSVRVDIEGEALESNATMSSMLRGLAVGLVTVFFLLSFQFRSYFEPIIVLTAIPFSLIGVIWGNMLMGSTFCLPGLLGFCALGGVVVNDSILLVEFIKRERRKGLSVADAARQASRHRFRAIFLTSVTTMAGLTPLLFETSRQAQVLKPVAISIVFGVLTSTLLVLLVIPAMYTILGDLGWIEKLGEGADVSGELPDEVAA